MNYIYSQTNGQQPQDTPSWHDESITFIVDRILFVTMILGIALWGKYVMPKLQKTSRDLIVTSASRETQDQIIASMIRIGYASGADRVVLCEFHNGDLYLSGKGVVKVSITQEYVSPGIIPIQDTMQNIPFQRIADELQPLFDDKSTYFHISMLEEGRCIDRWMAAMNVTEKKDYLLWQNGGNNDNLCYGILSLQYVGRKGNSCHFPLAPDYIKNVVIEKNTITALIAKNRTESEFKRQNSLINRLFS